MRQRSQKVVVVVVVSSRAGSSDTFSPFDLYVLDKFEGVLEGDFFNERRYADTLEMKVLLEACELNMAILHFHSLAQSLVLPSGHPWSDATREALQVGAMDLLVVHFAEGAFLHYDAVAYEDGTPWQLSAERQGLVRTGRSAR